MVSVATSYESQVSLFISKLVSWKPLFPLNLHTYPGLLDIEPGTGMFSMDEKYFAKKIESKWQTKWAETGAFETEIDDSRDYGTPRLREDPRRPQHSCGAC